MGVIAVARTGVTRIVRDDKAKSLSLSLPSIRCFIETWTKVGKKEPNIRLRAFLKFIVNESTPIFGAGCPVFAATRAGPSVCLDKFIYTSRCFVLDRSM